MEIGIKKESRAIIFGKTGSGKTFLAVHLVNAMPRPVVIFDTKHARSLLEAAEKYNWKVCYDSLPKKFENDIILFRPDAETISNPNFLDEIINNMVLNQNVCSIYIDELYQFHKSGHAGPGIVGLWTRGREMGFTTLASSQRPKFISNFCLTESDIYFIFTISKMDDRKYLYENTDFKEFLEKLPPRFFWYAKQEDEGATRFKPLIVKEKKVDKNNYEFDEEKSLTPRKGRGMVSSIKNFFTYGVK